MLTLPAERHQQPRARSYAQLANEQLNTGERGNALAASIKNAGVPDCLTQSQGGGLLGLPVVLYNAATGKCK
jgi:hypothetical protein